MNCTKFESAAQRLLDERTAELPAEMQAHLSNCRDCRCFWSGQLWLLKANQSIAPAEVPAGLASATLLRLKATGDTHLPEIAQRAVSARRGWAAALCCAASSALIMIFLSSEPSPRPEAPTISKGIAPAELEDAETLLASQSLSRLWNGVQAEYQELSQDTSETLTGLPELPKRDAILPVVTPWAPAWADPAESWRRVDRPISERVEAAFDFLWDALPTEPTQSL